MPSGRHGRSPLPGAVLAFLGLATVSCRTPPPPTVSAPTQLDRLIRHYPDLVTGRFAIIADFEDPKQFEIVQLIGTTDAARRAPELKRGRRETGGNALLFVSGSPNDALVFSNRTASNWFLKQDWRPYDLLLLSVNAPRSGLSLDLDISGGSATARRTARTANRLKEGWNQLRLDVGEMGDHVPLDDVQEMRLAVSGGAGVNEVIVDDVLLTSFHQRLAGDPEAPAGGLYVEQVGRRWRVGSRSENNPFELTFANGQIVAWHNLKEDPYRARNLLGGQALGPVPLRNDEGHIAFAPGTTPLPLSVETRLLEANEIRAILSVQWESANAETGGNGQFTAQRCETLFTVYASGQCYLSADYDSAEPMKVAWGYLLPADWQIQIVRAGDTLAANADKPESEGKVTTTWPFVVANHPEHKASLLLVPGDPGARLEAHSELGGPTERRTEQRGRMIVSSVEEDGGRSGHWHILLRSPSMKPSEAFQRAASYGEPRGVRLDAGRADSRTGAPRKAGGFDQTLGCFLAEPVDGVVRFTLDGRHCPFYSPVFWVHGGNNRPYWVYINHALHPEAVRVEDGGILIQLPKVIDEATLVEVLFDTPP